MEKRFDIKDIVLIGRTYAEYEKMFALHQRDLQQEKIIDVASGVSSFCAEAHTQGIDVTASDRIYCYEPAEIEKKCAADLQEVMEKLPPVMDSYRWDFFKDIESLGVQRRKAYTGFIQDYKSSQERYIHTEYPESRFADNAFTLALASHFLFLYDEHLSYEFHKSTILELIRITSDEIRVFPLVNLRYKKSDYVQKIMEEPEFRRYPMSIEKVDYEFLKNGNEVLKISVGGRKYA